MRLFLPAACNFAACVRADAGKVIYGDQVPWPNSTPLMAGAQGTALRNDLLGDLCRRAGDELVRMHGESLPASGAST
jgi:hypothetical protein